ncbi:MAG: hypothetical protein KJP00_02090 [Bacteroidia bacterium]|nr:hypothetical protein [Bacteroidia bacterium]
MEHHYAETIADEVRHGTDETTIRRAIRDLKLSQEESLYLDDFLDQQLALQKLREVKLADAKLIKYLGYALMGIAILFGLYSQWFGLMIFLLGVYAYRRGNRQKRTAEAMDSIEELLPKKPTIFHK